MKLNTNNAILLSVLLLVTANIKSQEKTFEYILASENDEFAISICEDKNEHVYFITSSTQISGTSQRKGLFLKLTDEGVLIDSTSLNDNEQSYFIHDILDDFSDSVVFFGVQYDTGSMNNIHLNISLVFFLNDKNLNPIDTLFFPLPANYSIFQSFIRKLSNEKYIALGSVTDTAFTFRPVFFLYEFSSTLDSLQFVFWPDSIGGGQDIRLQEDGNYWALINGFGAWRPRYWILDTSYHVLAKEIVPEYLTDPFGLKWDSDSTFYIVGEGGGDNDGEIGIMRQLRSDYNDLDKNIFSSWGTDYNDIPAIKGGLDFNDKDTIFIGCMGTWWGHFLETSNWFIVLQTDSLLNVRWERFYGGDAYYTMWKLIATSDGGCIAVGSRYDYLNSDIQQRDLYVLKLNKEGLLVGDEEAPRIQMQEAIVFPNPGTNQLKVRIAAQYQSSTFELYDITAKLVLSQNITGKWGEVNTSFLQAGSYIYRIFNDKGLSETGKWVKR